MRPRIWLALVLIGCSAEPDGPAVGDSGDTGSGGSIETSSGGQADASSGGSSDIAELSGGSSSGGAEQVPTGGAAPDGSGSETASGGESSGGAPSGGAPGESGSGGEESGTGGEPPLEWIVDGGACDGWQGIRIQSGECVWIHGRFFAQQAGCPVESPSVVQCTVINVDGSQDGNELFLSGDPEAADPDNAYAVDRFMLDQHDGSCPKSCP